MIRFTCPACGRSYDLTDDLLGHKIECECGAKFRAERPASPPAAAPPSDKSGPSDKSDDPPRLPASLMYCPDCGREVSRRAPACPHCGAPLQASAPDEPAQKGPIRVDTGENVLTRNRGCGDILIYVPAIIIILVLLAMLARVRG